VSRDLSGHLNADKLEFIIVYAEYIPVLNNALIVKIVSQLAEDAVGNEFRPGRSNKNGVEKQALEGKCHYHECTNGYKRTYYMPSELFKMLKK
jgi:hypothetical protein